MKQAFPPSLMINMMRKFYISIHVYERTLNNFKYDVYLLGVHRQLKNSETKKITFKIETPVGGNSFLDNDGDQ